MSKNLFLRCQKFRRRPKGEGGHRHRAKAKMDWLAEGISRQAAGPGGPNYSYIVPYNDELSNGNFREKAESGNGQFGPRKGAKKHKKAGNSFSTRMNKPSHNYLSAPHLLQL